MGNAGTGHGVGNCDKVDGDSTTGYIDKSSTASHALRTSTNSDNFTATFNSWTQTTQQDNVIVGDNVINLNRFNVGGNQNINFTVGGANVNVNGGNDNDSPSERPGDIIQAVPKVHFLEVAAYNVDNARVGESLKNFCLQIASGDKFDYSDVRFNWNGISNDFKVTDVCQAGDDVHLICESSEQVPMILNVYGHIWLRNSSQKIPFHGKMIAIGEITQAEEVEEVHDIYVAQAYKPHRVMLYSSGWTELTEDWSKLISFKVSVSKKPGMIRVAVGEAFEPHRVMMNHSRFSQDDWDNGQLMNFWGWHHHMQFWTLPES